MVLSTENQSAKRAGDMFGEHAKLYAAARPTYPSELYDYIATLCLNHRSVWDCAAGTGQASIELAERFEQVNVTDINTKQIKTASEKLSSYKNIKVSVQPAENTNFADNKFDLLTVAQALHWFDYEKFWPEVKRVLKPGALFAAWGYNWTRTDFHVNHMLEKDLFEVLKPFWSEKAQLLWNGYPSESIDFPFRRLDVREFSIKMNWNLSQVISYFRSWSSTQTALKVWGSDELFKKALQPVVDVWGDPKEFRVIEFPLHLCFGYNE